MVLMLKKKFSLKLSKPISSESYYKCCGKKKKLKNKKNQVILWFLHMLECVLFFNYMYLQVS